MRHNNNKTGQLDVLRGDSFEIEVNGRSLTAYPGETIAAVLLANGIRSFYQVEDDSIRGVYCGIGRCFSCRVVVNGQADIRACVTPVTPGIRVRTINREDES